jgi:hypothetical protein
MLFFLSYSNNLRAQSKFGIDGQVCLSTDASSLFLNFGGAGVVFKFKKFDFSLNMLPSLRFNSEKVPGAYGTKDKLFVRPVLGFSPQIVYRKFIICAPMYYLANDSKWTYTFGVGYKILKF